ncbi:threonine/serine ThrE exporter family protein [Elongatibacter sediminis]|uniref:Threonine/serine exporter family protein n=1 Tax=Elongatibacter sediminis TaxID=3119006 RepID=A0AAW9RM36_9GAMM
MSHSLPLEVRFLKRYARRLHEGGVPAHQLEGLVESVAVAVGYRCEIWSSPTAVLMAVRQPDDDEDQQPLPMQLIRLRPGPVNLANTTELYALAEDLQEQRIDLESAYEALRSRDVTPLYPASVRVMSSGLVSGAFALMLATGWLGAATAALAGMLVGLLSTSESRALREGNLDAVAAVLVTLLVYGLNHHLAGIDPTAVILSGLIYLVPGLSLTIAVTELSTDHLSSGSARLAGAGVTLLKLVLGVVIGTVVAHWLGWDAPGDRLSSVMAPPAWVQWPSLLVAALGFGVLFSVRPVDFPLAVLAAVTSYVVSRFASAMGGVEFGVLVAAFAVAVLGNSLGRLLRLPASLVRVPGIILLVPGALGYRAVTNLLLHGTANPQETALTVAILLVSLVGGLLIGNTVVPPRRHV